MWQSEAIAIIQLGLAVTLWPTISNRKSQVARSTSVPASIGLWILAAVYFSMGMWTAVGMSSICAVAWTFIATNRSIREVQNASSYD